MWLEQIKLENFRQYRDEEINFVNPTLGKNFAIIQGANGSGKTNILNAITWCLYGKEKHIGDKYKGLPIYNTLTSKGMEPGTLFKVKVSIQFIESWGGRILISRCLNYKVAEDGSGIPIPDYKSNSEDHSTLEMLRQIGRDMKAIDQPEFIVQKLIPEPIEQYFFFDGEQLDKYFRETAGKTIADAVFKISQIELLQRIIDHLTTMKSEFTRTEKNMSPKVQEIQDAIDAYVKGKDETQKRLENALLEKEKAQEEENRIREKLRESPISNVREYQQQREHLESEIENNLSNLIEVRKEQLKYLCDIAPITFSYSSLIKAKDLIDQSEAAGRIPPEYQPGFITKLIEQEMCICGRELKKGSEHTRILLNMLEESDILSEVSRQLIEDLGGLQIIMIEARKFKTELSKFNTQISRINERISSMQKSKAIIDEKIGVCDQEQIALWEEELQQYISQRERLTEDIGKYKAQIEAAIEKIKDFEKQRDAELRKQSKHQKLVKTLNFIKNSLEIAEEIKKKIMEDTRYEIESQTSRHFLDMIWKEKTYSGVKIDTNYNVSVEHISGKESIGTLSAGEREVLALSFVSALNNVSGFDVPMIIDTPLGRISSEPKAKVAQNIPSCFQEKQVILLVTDEEYSESVRMALKPNVGIEYQIQFKEYQDGSEAKVIKYECE